MYKRQDVRVQFGTNYMVWGGHILRHTLGTWLSLVKVEKDIWKVYKKVKKINFAELLKDFFNNDKLKGTISVLLRNIGLSANRASALTAVILFREYTLDPGYYPIGGMQKFSDILKDIFINYGGEVLFSRKVIKILTSNRKVKGIVLEDNKKVFANIVVSNTDATMTFEELLDIKTLEVSIVKRLEISPSPFVVYLGLRKNLLKDISNDISNIWPFFSYDIRKIPLMSRKDIINGKVYITMISFQSLHDPILIKNNSTTIGIFATVNYESSNFWKEYKEKLSLLMILKAQELIPFSDQDIDKKVVATPYTFYEYTLNKNGSAFGWASIPSQISASILPQSTSVEGLFLVGHWTTIGSGQGGVPKVSFSGRRVASIILKKMGKEWKYGAYQ